MLNGIFFTMRKRLISYTSCFGLQVKVFADLGIGFHTVQADHLS